MRLDHTFSVPVPADEAWRVLLDVPRVAPCMPGATLTEHDDDTFAGTVKVKVGPIALTYKGTGRFVTRDEAARTVVIEASGREGRGAGTAAATVTASLVPAGDATNVRVATDLTVTGRPAQFGRGMIADVSGRIIDQFAGCLARQLAAGTHPPAPEPAAVPVATPAAGPAPATVTAPAPTAGAPLSRPPETEAIDLLQVTGANELIRRYGPVALIVALAVFLGWLLGHRSARG